MIQTYAMQWWLRDEDINAPQKNMIDGESSKAELLQSSKCSSGDMTAVILTLTWSKQKCVIIWYSKVNVFDRCNFHEYG